MCLRDAGAMREEALHAKLHKLQFERTQRAHPLGKSRSNFVEATSGAPTVRAARGGSSCSLNSCTWTFALALEGPSFAAVCRPLAF